MSAPNEPKTCQFPTGPGGKLCGRPAAVDPSKPGRKTDYCDLPDHNRAKAFTARAALGRASAQAAIPAQEQLPDDQQPPNRPISYAVQGLNGLHHELHQLAEQTINRISDVLQQASTWIEITNDPDKAAEEIREIREHADAEIAHHKDRANDAERAQRAAERTAETAIEERAQADEAATATIATSQRLLTAVAQAVTVIVTSHAETARIAVANAEAAVDDARAARDETERVRQSSAAGIERIQQSSAEEIERAQTAANAAIQEAAQLAEHEAEQLRAELADQLAALRTETANQVAQAKHEVDAAHDARIRAEAEKKAADDRAADDRAIVKDLRKDLADLHGQLENLRTSHTTELDRVRDDARADLKAQRESTHEQLAALRTALDASTAAADAFKGQVGDLATRLANAERALAATMDSTPDDAEGASSETLPSTSPASRRAKSPGRNQPGTDQP